MEEAAASFAWVRYTARCTTPGRAVGADGRRLLVLGCFLEVVATLLLVLPILAPALVPLGADPVHFSIIFTHNLEIALVHPPTGLNLHVLATISTAPIGEVIAASCRSWSCS